MLSTIALVASFAAIATPSQAATAVDFGVAQVTQDSARVTWSRTLDWCFTSYDVQFRQTGEDHWLTQASIRDPQRTDHWITGLSPSHSYEARVVDVDCLGRENSTVERFTTTAEGPLGLSSSAITYLTLGTGLTAAAVAFVLLRRAARARRVRASPVLIPFDPSDPALGKCVKCGQAVATQYCGTCGAKQP